MGILSYVADMFLMTFILPIYLPLLHGIAMASNAMATNRF